MKHQILVLVVLFLTGCSRSDIGGDLFSAGGGASTATTATTATGGGGAGGSQQSSSSGTSTATSSSTGGTCSFGACATVADCCTPPIAQECQVLACVDGLCRTPPVPMGQQCGPIGGAPRHCDGLGQCVLVAPPGCMQPMPPGPEDCLTECDDGNPCTQDYCTDTGCMHAAFPSGVECGTENVCKSGFCCKPIP